MKVYNVKLDTFPTFMIYCLLLQYHEGYCIFDFIGKICFHFDDFNNHFTLIPLRISGSCLEKTDVTHVIDTNLIIYVSGYLI